MSSPSLLLCLLGPHLLYRRSHSARPSRIVLPPSLWRPSYPRRASPSGGHLPPLPLSFPLLTHVDARADLRRFFDLLYGWPASPDRRALGMLGLAYATDMTVPMTVFLVRSDTCLVNSIYPYFNFIDVYCILCVPGLAAHLVVACT
jgi:hypothetical protein